MTETPANTTLSPLKRAFLALEAAQARVAALENAAREPIAIIGLGCRVPGGGRDSASFWRILQGGVDAISRVPRDRWDIEAYFDPDPQAPGKIATREGGFLESIDQFDAPFFGIAPREAHGMDPQQRLLLEVSWEALEHAGQAPDRLERTRTGVYVGVCNSDYTYLQMRSGDPSLLDAHFTSGMAHSIFSGRLSYLLGLQGPSISIDTACSSSLVAVHLACQALRAGECRLALAGGVNLILGPEIYIALSHSRMLAPDGRCKTFDASADGFARAEGCGVVVLKKLSDAQADGDRILAVIRGSAVNQDGPSSGLTAPNGPAQEAVIRDALSNAGLAPREVSYVEAHGTGTQLGDPLEVHALGAVFGADRAAAPPLLIGSAKTNLGHLEAAAGVTALIKVVLSLQHQTIPAHLHFRTPNPHIHWDDFPLSVPTEATAWQPIDGRRIAGISSFGFSGTNAHLVVEEAPGARALTASSESRPHLFTLSARDEQALKGLASRYVTALEGRRDEELAMVCYTASTGRAQFAHRAAFVVRSMQELRVALTDLAQGKNGSRQAVVSRRDGPRIAFLFTGQGSQYAGMAKGLYESFAVFRTALDECARLVAPHLDRPLLEVLFPPAGAATPLDETRYTQPALFAIEYAIAQLWRAWGVTPNVLLGHSVGELVAACIAGVMDLGDALRLIARRGALMQSLPAGGTMAAISAPEPQVGAVVAQHTGRVSIAAINGPAQTVISGVAADVAAIADRFGASGVRVQPLTVSHAFHSPLVEPILESFEREVASVRLAPPRLRLISNLSGRAVEGDEITKPVYWRRHVREAVRFSDGLRALLDVRPDCLIEIGPHPTLSSFASALIGDGGPVRLASLRKGTADVAQILEALAAVYLAGAQIDWRAVTEPGSRRITELPTYPFQRTRYWFRAQPAASAMTATRGNGTQHPLLGRRLRNASQEVIYEAGVSADSPPFVRQHRVLGNVVLPATAYLDTLLACGRDLLRTDSISVENVAVKEAMLLAEGGDARTLQTVCMRSGERVATVSMSSAPAAGDDTDPWTGHVTATVRATAFAPPEVADLPAMRRACSVALVPQEFYAGFEKRGLDFGPGFRAIRKLWHGPSEALGEVELAADLVSQAGRYRFHPVLLDGCMQVMAAALPADDHEVLYLPIGIGRYVFHRAPGIRCWSHAKVEGGSGETRRADLAIVDEEGHLLAEVREVQLKRVTRDALERLGERWLDQCLYATRWLAVSAAADQPVHVWSAAGLAATASAEAGRLRDASGVDGYDSFLPRLEDLCAQYTVCAMRRLGWTPAAGTEISASELASSLEVASEHRRLFTRLLQILEEVGSVARNGERWRVLRPLPDIDTDAVRAALEATRPPGAAAELELTARVANRLAEALRGEIEPMQLLFPGGSLDTAERLYRDAPTAKFFNGLMAEVMSAACAARAAGRRVRILEIGAGTGGTTAHVLPRLPADAFEYTFTDVGPLFVARAKEHFGSIANTRFEVLDLESEPQSQGFADRQFDVVIASNVIHATADLRRTLSRVRSLLAPGGLLAMLEVTAPQRWFDLTVGLTSGWWAYTDTALRPDYATLSREKWLALLPECGFDECVALPGGDVRGCLSLQALLLARASRSRWPVASNATWLVFAEPGGVGGDLVSRLLARGDRCLVVRPGEFSVTASTAQIDPALPTDYGRLLEHLRAIGVVVRGAVHAWCLDTPPGQEGADAHQRGTLSAMRLAQALVAQSPTPRLWLVTRGAQAADAAERALSPAQAAMWGLGKALALEHPELRPVCIDLSPSGVVNEAERILEELGENGAEAQVALRNDERRVARLTRLRRGVAASTAGPASWRLVPETAGSLEAFRREPFSLRVPAAGEVAVAVEASALNFKDVLNALGMYPGNPGPLGGECAGRVTAVGAGVTHVRPGDEVMVVAGGSFASHVMARAELVQPRPQGVSAEEGASFSIAYLTAEFCLAHVARLGSGERVLIHAAAGGVGLAAVRLAQRTGAQVFATAGSPWKRELLRSIGVEHVFDSRGPEFADEILARTGGEGVDVVLNSLTGELIEASFRALARDGRFVEIGKRGIKDEAWVRAQGRDHHYTVVDWGDTAAREPALIGEMFARLVEELRRCTLRPLPRHVFALDQVANAFRLMAQARHAGKIVVRHGTENELRVRADGTYLITGGLSGLGLCVARWLAQQGAGQLVLIGRRGITREAEPVLAELRASGVAVLAEAMDVSDERALGALLERVRNESPPLRGVLHSAGVLDNAGLLQQDEQRFQRVFAPKVVGASVLDRLTRSDSLDWFILFSSIASVLGAAGQSNHSAANACLDVLAHERRSRGLPALSINWGVWTEIGAAADLTERLAAQGLGTLRPDQGLLALQRAAQLDVPQAVVLPIDWTRYLQSVAAGSVPPFLAEVAGSESAPQAPSASSAPIARASDLRAQLSAVAVSRRRPLVATFVREHAARALGLDRARPIDPQTPLGELGLDSLLAVELRNALGTELEAPLPATLLFDYPTLDTLTDYLVGTVLAETTSTEPSPAPVAESADAPEGLVGSIEAMSDDEVDRLIAARAQRKA
jgi:acyl transferase domain-containing protein/NADPH:quinone reductase-like Zn-dependent oxidoreductase/SAM-dependent methyltransferase/acyl carrier protein